jgi:LPS sulfotransferase NodH
MKVLILCEPRTGSTNLVNWFGLHKFSKFYNPVSNPNNEWNVYNNRINIGKRPSEWIYNSKNLVFKEDGILRHDDFNSLIEYSDRVIVLYRENLVEQRESYIHAIKSGNWDGMWDINDGIKLSGDTNHFKIIKEQINSYKTMGFFNISYEQLYFYNRIYDLINFIGITELNANLFPFGYKYRTDTKNKKLI